MIDQFGDHIQDQRPRKPLGTKWVHSKYSLPSYNFLNESWEGTLFRKAYFTRQIQFSKMIWSVVELQIQMILWSECKNPLPLSWCQNFGCLVLYFPTNKYSAYKETHKWFNAMLNKKILHSTKHVRTVSTKAKHSCQIHPFYS